MLLLYSSIMKKEKEIQRFIGKAIVLLFIICIAFNARAGDEKKYVAKKSENVIVIDGVLNEEAWSKAQKAENFHQNYPSDTSLASSKTTAFVTYDDDNIYVAAICYDVHSEKEYVVQSLKRDFEYPINDAFAVYFDPFNDKSNGFSFAVNPHGVQREGLIQDGGNWGVSTAWDNKWYSEVTRHSDKWIVEIKIPLKSIRYKGGNAAWGVNFSRNELKGNENSAWSKVPRNYNVAALAFTGVLQWEEPLKKAGANVSLIPYAIAGGNLDFQLDRQSTRTNAGIDAKIAVTSSLNLDLTINPDFSQVEVDQQVTNLSRFSLYFPERRQFFLENEDLFARFGFSKIRPFFSRQIGLHQGSSVPILGGARLSGKLNKNWRIGLMNIQTEGGKELDVNAQNYTVAVFQRRVGVRSNIGGVFVNRQSFNGTSVNYADYNRVIGLDYNIFTASNKIQGKIFAHASFSPKMIDYTHASWIMYNTEKLTVHWNHEYVGENYRADVGFVPRITQYNTETNEYEYNAYWRLEPSISYRFYPKSEKIVSLQPGIYWSQYFNVDWSLNERLNNIDFKVNFTDKSTFSIAANQSEVFLPFNTDVTFSGNAPISSGTYLFNYYNISYSSSAFDLFSYSASADYGNYYIGNKITGKMSLNYRFQPWVKLSVNAQYDKINMPDGYKDLELYLVGPQVHVSFNKKLFFSTFIQYNTQVNNVNLNARLQYRFKPMSDLYIVYTDNYNANLLGIKNRAVVVKFIYWLNL